MRSFRVALVAVILCAGFSAAAEKGPPPEVVAGFDDAVMVENAEDFSGSYTSQTVSIVQKPNGKARHDMEVVIEVDRPVEGAEKKKLVSFVRDGEDVSEKHRSDIEEPADGEGGRDQDDDAEQDDGEMDFVPPWGDDAGRYEFGPVKSDGSTATQSFRPRPDQKDVEGLAVGHLTWNASTLDPVSAELEVSDPPKPLKRLKIVMEFERQGDRIFAVRMVTDGFAKVLLMKREFHVDVNWTGIRPEGSGA